MMKRGSLIKQLVAGDKAFTLVEVAIALAVGSIVLLAIYSTYSVSQKSHVKQKQITDAQQNLRGAMMVLEHELRMVGYDPIESNNFGIIDIRRLDPVTGNPSLAGQPSISYSADFNEDGQINAVGAPQNEVNTFRLMDELNDGRLSLGWNSGGGFFVAAENIQVMGMAFAIDNDNDGQLDTGPGAAVKHNIIWAIDTNNDNLLDTHIDTNDDGRIDLNDDANADNVITGADGTPLPAPVPMTSIRAIRIWLLAVTLRPLEGYLDNKRYMVGGQIVIPPPNDRFRRRVMVETIKLRNM